MALALEHPLETGDGGFDPDRPHPDSNHPAHSAPPKAAAYCSSWRRVMRWPGIRSSSIRGLDAGRPPASIPAANHRKKRASVPGRQGREPNLRPAPDGIAALLRPLPPAPSGNRRRRDPNLLDQAEILRRPERNPRIVFPELRNPQLRHRFGLEELLAGKCDPPSPAVGP